MRKAFVIGGSGQIGSAICELLAKEGFHVSAAHRGSKPGPSVDVEWIVLDREDSVALRAAARGSDVVIDTVPYTESHADQLVSLGSDVGSLIAISTGSVYQGRNGSYFDIATSDADFPDFPVPITEDCATIENDRPTYGPMKAAMERRLSTRSTVPVSILRPGAVHGPRSPKLREFYFMQRVFDGRPRVVLSRGGESRFSTSSTANVAALALACVQHPGAGVLNAVDEEGLSTREIARTVFEVMGHEPEILSFPGAAVGNLGATPWDCARPFVCSMERARNAVGYVPAVSYREAIERDVEWVTLALKTQTWQELFPSVASRYGTPGWFPYAEEDAWATGSTA
ncbi:NAD-dependent epimerase/dehydratase family protein [Salinibacterium sp.]|uniref:NAD-dependent epimerase/dehydratase family protein n=1 Tax=Salinibacterium sp. TaxID=1915057 RepID=UPI00286ADE4B|nr:NAD-dependent epimerase/dehydratase family protein [Salinibacterium sp.]